MADKVVIVVEEKRYEVTKSKLSERSRYFSSMFNGQFLERNQNTINIKGITCKAWEDILHYLNTGNIRPKPYDSNLHKEILELLLASDMLLFPDIRELSVKALCEVLTAENCLYVLEVANKLDIQSVIHKARAVALWNADVTTYTEAFYSMDMLQAESFLSDPGLHSYHGEWGVWEALNRWIISGSDSGRPRSRFLTRLIKCISLRYISRFHLRKISLNEGVRSNPVVSAAVKGVIDGISTAPGIIDFINRWRCMPRRQLPLVPAVVAKISVSSSSASPFIVRFSFEERKFIPYLRLDEVERNLNSLVGFKVIADGSKLYMLGGEIITLQPAWYLAVWEYDQILGYWNFLTNLRRETRHAGACVLGTDLYVIGGFARDRMIQNTVSKFSLIKKEWTDCAPLPRPMYALPCCAFKGKIYAIKTEVLEYDPILDMWEALDIDLPTGDVFCVAMADKDNIFISGLQKTVYKFDPTLRKSQLVVVGRFAEDCTQACLVNDYIYNVSQASMGNYLICERVHIRSGHREIVWRRVAGTEIDTFSPNHQHGCFPLLMY